MKLNLAFTFLVILTVNSCSSVITKEDCKKDMKNFGIEHGKKGLSKLTDEISSTCIRGEESVNLENYEMGFKIGWSSFCTSFNGFDMGRKGDTYKSFCPPDKEDLFHEKFLIGKKVYEKKDQVIELEEKIQELTSNVEADPASREELKKYQDYLRTLKREIQALEQQGVSLVHTPSS